MESVPKPVLAALFVSVLTAALDIAMVIPVIPVIGETFALDARLVAWVYAVFTLCNLAGVPVMGWLADNFGRRVVLLSDIALFLAGAAVVGFADSYSVVLLGRGMQGLAASGIFPVVASIVGDIYPSRNRGRALGVLGSVFGVAFIFGPPISGILLEISWRLVFFAAMPIGLIAFVLVLAGVPPLGGPERVVRLDVSGLGLLVAMVFGVAYSLNGLDADNLASSASSPGVWLPLVSLLVLVPLFIAVERRASRPVVRLTLFGRRDVRIAVLLAVGAGFCEAAMVFTPYYAGEAFGVDRSTASFMFIPLAVAVAIGSPLFGRLIDRTGIRAAVSAASVMLLLGLAGLSVSASSVVAFYGGSVAVGLGLAGLLGSSLNYIMLGAALPAERATTQGFVTLSLNVGLSVGAVMVGAVVASYDAAVSGFRVAFIGLSILAGVLFVLSLGLGARRGSRSVSSAVPD